MQAERNASAHVIAEAQSAEPELKRGNWFKEQKFNNLNSIKNESNF